MTRLIASGNFSFVLIQNNGSNLNKCLYLVCHFHKTISKRYKNLYNKGSWVAFVLVGLSFVIQLVPLACFTAPFSFFFFFKCLTLFQVFWWFIQVWFHYKFQTIDLSNVWYTNTFSFWKVRGDGRETDFEECSPEIESETSAKQKWAIVIYYY